MKRSILAALLALAIALPLAAQDQPASQGNQGQMPSAWGRGAYRAHRRNAAMAALRRLNLSPEQKQQLQPMFQQHRQQVQAIRNDSSLTPEQKKEKIAQLRQDFQTQVNSVLTADQQAQLKQFRERRKPAFAKLNLSEDQKAKIKPLFDQQHQQVMAVRQDSSLTPQQKRDKIREIRQSTMAQLNSILTPEQQQQWEQMRQQRRQHWQERQPGPPPQAGPPQGV